MNYMPFICEKTAYWKKKYAANKGEAIPLPLSLLNPPLHMM